MMIRSKDCCAGFGLRSLPYWLFEVKKGSPQVRPAIVMVAVFVDGYIGGDADVRVGGDW